MSPLPESDLRLVAEYLEPLRDRLAGARLFVTGGTGFLGRWLVESLAFAAETVCPGLRLVVLSRDPEGFLRRAPHLAHRDVISFRRGDVRDFLIPEGSFDGVLHVATVAPAPSGPQDQLDVVLGGTRRTLELAARSGARRYLFVSSGAVYGPQPAGVERRAEDVAAGAVPADPRFANGEGKRAGELLAVLEGEACGLEVSIARGFAFLGPLLPLDGQFAAGNFLRDALAGGPIVVEGDGTPIRTYLHAADMAGWLLTVFARGAAGRAYNVGGEEQVSIRELAELVASAVHPRPSVVVRRVPDPDRARERYVPDLGRARGELGLVPRVSLDDAILRTLAWLGPGSGRIS